MMNSDNKAYARQLPQMVSLIAIVIFTLFVALCSAFTIYITYGHFSTQKGWTVCAMSVGSVCLFVGYCWYRLFIEKPPVEPEVFHEQAEGVWPPAPTHQGKLSRERNRHSDT